MKKYIAVLFVIIITVFFFTLLSIRTLRSSRIQALSGKSTLSIQPSIINTSSEITDKFHIYVNPNTEIITAVEIVIDYDPTIIEVTDIAPGNFFTDHTAAIGTPQEIIKNIVTPGRVHYALGFPLGSNFFSSRNGNLAIVSYKAKNIKKSGMIRFITNGIQQTMISDINAQNVLLTAVDAAISVASNAITSTPTLTSDPSPNPPVCALKEKGDGDCDSKITLSDFEIWRKEYFNTCSSLCKTNFNFPGSTYALTDMIVDIADFEIWRKNYYV